MLGNEIDRSDLVKIPGWVMDKQPPESSIQNSRSMRCRRWIIAILFCVVALVAVWRLFFSGSSVADEFKPQTWNGEPKFVETRYPTHQVPDNAGIRLRLGIAYSEFMLRHGKKNPAASSFPPTSLQICSVHGLLNQSMQVTGTRYLIAYEAAAGSVQFGHSNILNGTQWVAAFEGALQTNRPDCFDFQAKRTRRENLLLIREKPGVVKVIPTSRLADYQKAGLVDASYQPEPITTSTVSAPK